MIRITQDALTVSSDAFAADPVTIRLGEQATTIGAGEQVGFATRKYFPTLELHSRVGRLKARTLIDRPCLIPRWKKMLRLSISISIVILLFGTAAAEEVPFALAPDLEPHSNNAFVPSLSEIMQIIQLKHIKLWQAGSAKNWSLARFEIEQIRDTFFRTAIFYKSIPATYVLAVDMPLAEMKNASEANDSRRYDAAYTKLTGACNACHQAANVSFITIKNPTSSPFGDEKF